MLAAVVHRTIDQTPIPGEYTQFDVTDEWTIQTAPYTIDVVKGTVTISGPWTKIPGEALHVHKLPMPGWGQAGASTGRPSACAESRSRLS